MNDEVFPLQRKRVFVAGHSGMAGSAIVRRLGQENCEIITVDHNQLDLLRQDAVEKWMKASKPDVVFVAAAKVGGIFANSTRPAEFIYENLMIESNLIHSAWRTGVKKLLFLGSSCIYPRQSAQPMKERYLLSGALEPTNEAYAIAKIAGIKLCQAYRAQYGCDFISAMPTNLYGPQDRYDLVQGHVVAALIMKIHAAKTAGATSIELWGTGLPRREFLFSDDMADGCIFLMKHYSGSEHVNLGTGVDMTIRELAEAIAEAAGWSGKFNYDLTKPDGVPQKLMDVSRLTAMGWVARTPFSEGIKRAYQSFHEGAA